MNKLDLYRQRYQDPLQVLGQETDLSPEVIKELTLYFKILPPGILGQTNKCVVIKGKYLQNNREYAIKIALDNINLIEEANVLMQLRHPNIVMFKKMLLIQEKVCIV
jgi:hypothetical protein